MQAQRNSLLITALAASLMFLHADAALARSKKSNSGGDLGIQRDSNGVPIIVKGFRSDRAKMNRAGAARSGKFATRSARVPRGSSSPVLPRTGTTTGQVVQPYNPPRITTSGDRTTNAIHSYPLQKGLGNNPTDQQTYIRQNSN